VKKDMVLSILLCTCCCAHCLEVLVSWTSSSWFFICW